MDIEFQIPGEKSPGYLKRQRRALKLQESFSNKTATSQDIDELVEFLADFIIKPESRDEAVEALWLASEEELTGLLDSISDIGTVSPKK